MENNILSILGIMALADTECTMSISGNCEYASMIPTSGKWNAKIVVNSVPRFWWQQKHLKRIWMVS